MDARASVQQLLERGCSLIEEGRVAEALEDLRRAYEREPSSARVRSYYGLCIGLVERRFDESVELCSSAARQEFFNPDLYLNMARIHLAFGFKSDGIRYLRRGKMIDPANDAIERELRELGFRGAPVLGFLPRRHLLNRWLGSARHLFERHQHRSRVAA